jgi:SAM-dependent methyltransferase
MRNARQHVSPPNVPEEYALSSADRARYLSRYASGEWRAEIFADMVASDLNRFGPACTVVDVGCGGGFDDSKALQRRLVQRSGHAIGVEPDPDTEVADCFHQVHRTILEEAPISPASVHVAYAVMVAEHVAEPDRFMAKVADILVDGGVFWSFTVDLRHWASWASVCLDKVAVKNFYLDRLHGKRGEDRYSNFPVHYKLNTPAAARRHAPGNLYVEPMNFFRMGAEDFNLPRILRPVNHLVDRLLGAVGAPGSNLVVRATRISRGATSR